MGGMGVVGVINRSTPSSPRETVQRICGHSCRMEVALP